MSNQIEARGSPTLPFNAKNKFDKSCSGIMLDGCKKNTKVVELSLIVLFPI